MRSLRRKPKTRADRRYRRHLRVRKKVEGTRERPRLVVYRSLKHIYVQLVDDQAHRTLLTVSDLTLEGEGSKAERSAQVGRRLAERAKESGITRVVFDRAGYKYHGRVKAVADGAREGGLEF
jgi:large subunit ribosomal protein L18